MRSRQDDERARPKGTDSELADAPLEEAPLVLGARELGLRVFGVTVDEHAHDYFPYIFGRGAYAIFPNITRLPVALPAIYRQITS